jgi:hypothetical protein
MQINTRAITETLESKFKHWLSSIEDRNVRDLVEKHTIISGGCIPSLILGEEVNDFDIYFRNFYTMHEVVNYYIGRFNPKCKDPTDKITLTMASESTKKIGETDNADNRRLRITIMSSKRGNMAGMDGFGLMTATEKETQEHKDVVTIEYKNSANYLPVFVTTNAITLSDKVQCMVRFWGEPDEIHENYDFAHATSYWSSWNKSLNLRKRAVEAIKNKRLEYINSKYPVCALFRIKKFLDRGWSISDEDVKKIGEDITKLDLNDKKVRREQMIGISTRLMTYVDKNAQALATGDLDHEDFMEILEQARATGRGRH